jgi:hypothetical protein
MTVRKTAEPGFGGFYDPFERWEKGQIRNVHDAYIAGLLDGEGCFSIYTRGNFSPTSYRGEITCGMTNPEPLAALMRFGGHISHQSRQREGWARRYTWKLADPEAMVRLLGHIEPYVIVKRPQAGVLLKFCHLRLSKARTAKVTPEMLNAMESLRLQIRDLNEKGVDYAIAA